MKGVSIILTIEKEKPLVVEVIGECENEYNVLALYAFSSEVIKKAKECGGEKILWTKEPQFQKFCYAFRFKTEEDKVKFLESLSASS